MRRIFLGPSFPALGNNKLFDDSNQAMNRDGQMLPFVRLKRVLEAMGFTVQTADYLFGDVSEDFSEYWSLGLMDKLGQLTVFGR